MLDGYHHDVYFYEMIFIINYVLVSLYQTFIYEITCKITYIKKNAKIFLKTTKFNMVETIIVKLP